MVTINCQQGTLDWIIQRLFRLTASEMKTNITSTGKLSKSEAAMAAIDKLIAGIDLAKELQSEKRQAQIEKMDEWELKKFMAHYTGDKFKGNLHTERGNDLESDALAYLSERAGIQFEDVGMCVMGDNVKAGLVSCSPDGIAYTSDRRKAETGGELKCPTLAKYYGIVADNVLPDDYKIQVHSSMAICEVDTWHFGAYFPGKPIFHLCIRRDAFTDTIEKSLQEFITLYRERYRTVMERISGMERAGRAVRNVTKQPTPILTESLI